MRQSGHGTALERAVQGADAEWTLTNQLLAEVADFEHLAAWQRSSGKKHDKPKPISRPGVRPEATVYGKGALPLDQMADWLGWEAEMTEMTRGSED